MSKKLKLYKSIIIPILLYGSETWTPHRHHSKRTQVFTNSCIRIITGTSFWEKKKNTQLRTNAKIQRVDVMMQHRRLQWLGHVERMNEERIPRKILVSRIVGGKRSKEGQKKRWQDMVYADLKTLHLGKTWKTEALDRKQWRQKIKLLSIKANKNAEMKE